MTPFSRFRMVHQNQPQRRSVIYHSFRMRYTAYLMGTVFISTLFVGLTAGYFLLQNYKIYIDWATIHSPELLANLHHEKVWVIQFLIATFIGTTIFYGFLGLRITSKLFGSMLLLQEHLRGMIRGRWFQEPLELDESEEFGELIESYNYFYHSLQAQVKSDIKRLEKITVDRRNHEAFEAWSSILEEKRQQLGQQASNLYAVEENPSDNRAS